MAEAGNRKAETGKTKQGARQPRKVRLLRARVRSPLPVPASRSAVSAFACAPDILTPSSSPESTVSRFPRSGFRHPVSGLGGFPFPVPGFIKAIRGRPGDVVYKTYGDKIITTRVPCFEGYVQARRNDSAARKCARPRRRAGRVCRPGCPGRLRRRREAAQPPALSAGRIRFPAWTPPRDASLPRLGRHDQPTKLNAGFGSTGSR
jgi:hypothetical protein